MTSSRARAAPLLPLGGGGRSKSGFRQSNKSSPNLAHPSNASSLRVQITKNATEQNKLAHANLYNTIAYLLKKTHFDTEQIKALLDMYKSFTKMSQMDRVNFRNILHNTFGLTDDIMLDRIFSVFDMANKGVITETEWVIGLSTMFQGTFSEQIDFCYNVFDYNQDQTLTRSELYSSLKGCIHPIPGEEIDPEEGASEIVEILMKKLDLDKDGVVKFNDFKTAVNNDPILLQSIGECLPNVETLTTFLTIIQSGNKMRNYSMHLSHPKDPCWTREKNKFDPKKLRRTATTEDHDLVRATIANKGGRSISFKNTKTKMHNLLPPPPTSRPSNRSSGAGSDADTNLSSSFGSVKSPTKLRGMNLTTGSIDGEKDFIRGGRKKEKNVGEELVVVPTSVWEREREVIHAQGAAEADMGHIIYEGKCRCPNLMKKRVNNEEEQKDKKEKDTQQHFHPY